MDTYPIPVRSLELYFKIDGKTLERNYKEHLSGFRQWNQRVHATDWVLVEENMGESLCLDETMLCRDLTTFVSNKDGHCKKGSVIAAVRGTKSDDVAKVLERIPLEKREKVREVTMDFSDSMRRIATTAFPSAMITIDHFHIIQISNSPLEELRLKYKREATKMQKQQEAEHKKHLAKLAKQRKYYRRRHPKNYKGKKRGRKPQRLNQRFKPQVFENGETMLEMLTRCRYQLAQSGDNWTQAQRERARILFGMFPKLREAYSLVCSLRSIFSNKNLSREDARVRLHQWYDKVAASTLREVKSVRDTIKSREEDVLNFFVNRSTNASAESLNSKMKGFRTQSRGVTDLAFFMYRVYLIFGRCPQKS